MLQFVPPRTPVGLATVLTAAVVAAIVAGTISRPQLVLRLRSFSTRPAARSAS